MEKRIFSGIKPSGNLHLGNYIGAIKEWVKGQDDGFNIFCVVDLHAITVPQSPSELAKNSFDLVAMLLASGINPEKSLLFVQSHNPDHANFGWILNCYISMGQMSRMTQFKEKSEGKDSVSVGLFDYPALMAADILLYGTTHVPVGEDQKQHIELARDVAEKFNKKYGDTLHLPKLSLGKTGTRIMSLTDPSKKMSKSVDDPMGTISLFDSNEAICKKIASATTDSLRQIKYNKDKQPGISNLLEIYSSLSGKEIQSIVDDFDLQKESKDYGHLKEEVSIEVVKTISELKEKYDHFRDETRLHIILEEGSQKAYEISHPFLKTVYKKIGFIT